MTLAELLADLEAQLENGVDSETPVLVAIQPRGPLVHELAGLAAVYAGEDRQAPCTHLLLAAGAQRDRPTPYTTGAEDAMLREMGWRE
jgi:hypothetical protein